MSAPSGLLPKVVPLIPLVGLSTVLVVNVARVAPTEVVVVAAPPATDGATAPATSGDPLGDAVVVLPPATTAPASVWVGDAGVTGTVPAVAAGASSADIPAVALAAYQRAATVMDSADRACHLDWSLLAGIGRVESDHGRTDGNRLAGDGVATPGVLGPALTGSDGRMLVADTDSGSYDADTVYDHAVGPLQFLPSTWSAVGVDADGDGRRNPQDVDDAALSAAVYLCSGSEDLATAAGQRAAVLHYNRSAAYVDSVLAAADGYHATSGLYGAIHASTAGVAVRAVPAVAAVAAVATSEVETGGPRPPGAVGPAEIRHGAHGVATAHGVVHPHGGVGATPPATPQPPAGQPQPPAGVPTPEPPAAATRDELTALCSDRIGSAYPDATPDARQQALAACVDELTGRTLPDAQRDVDPLVATLPDRFPGLRGPSSDPSADPTPPPSDPGTDPGTSSDPATQPADPPPSDPSPSASPQPAA